MGTQPRRGRNTDDRVYAVRPRPLNHAEFARWATAVQRETPELTINAAVGLLAAPRPPATPAAPAVPAAGEPVPAAAEINVLTADEAELADVLSPYTRAGLITAEHVARLLRLDDVYAGPLVAKFEVHPTAAEWTPGGAWSLLRDLRPEDMPVCWFGFLVGQAAEPTTTKAAVDLIVSACERVDRLLVANGGKLRQSVVAAFWWASAAVYHGLDADRLAAALAEWEGRFFSAILAVHSGLPKPGKGATQAEHDEWWGYRADLRHSHASDFGTDRLPDSVRAIAREYGLSVGGDLMLPSQMQPWSLNRRSA